MAELYRTTAHTVYKIAYHFVWCPKYRRTILNGDMADRLKEIIYEIAEFNELEIISLEIMPDHVHLFISAPPRFSPSKIMEIIKTNTSKKLYEEFPRLKRTHWGGHLWSRSYFVGTAGEVTTDVIQKYIEHQKTGQPL